MEVQLLVFTSRIFTQFVFLKKILFTQCRFFVITPYLIIYCLLCCCVSNSRCVWAGVPLCHQVPSCLFQTR